MSSDPDVLVVGAGPTGLTLALQAHVHGAAVRVVERRPEPGRPSRAMVMHRRTLASLRPLGVTVALLERADAAPRVALHLGARTVTGDLAGLVAARDGGLPPMALLRQADVEQVLAEALRVRGVVVERGTELLDAAATADGRVAARLRSAAGVEHAGARFVVSCDGADSTVRSDAGIRWPGRPYREEVVLADVELTGLDDARLHVVAGRAGLVFVFPLGEGATWRLLATRRARAGAGGPVPASEVQGLLDRAGLPAAVIAMPWSARVPLQHRLASAYRAGPLFVAGDAAHVHSPAAAQGMNTGIGDAVGLGWRLAYASGPEHEALLASYEHERRPVARQVLALTHTVFWAEASTSALPAVLRGTVVPAAAPLIGALLRRPALLTPVFALLSQGWVSYRSGPLTAGGRGRPRPGSTLPDTRVAVGGRRVPLPELVASPGMHLLLDRDARDVGGLGPRVTVHRLDGAGTGALVVRPDGRVGLRCAVTDPARVRQWLRLAGAL